MASENEDLASIVQRFVAAEDALSSIAERREELRTATRELQETRASTSASTTSSMEALESVREDLRSRIQADERLAAARAELDVETGDVMSEIRDVLASLRAIDPTKFATELAELRRDGADNAAEVREVRRLTADVQREQALIRIVFKDTTDSISRLHALESAVREDVRVNGVSAAGAAKQIEAHLGVQDGATASLGRRINVTMALVSVTLVVALVGLFV